MGKVQIKIKIAGKQLQLAAMDLQSFAFYLFCFVIKVLLTLHWQANWVGFDIVYR